jgi:lysophospholipase L1-like esterase
MRTRLLTVAAAAALLPALGLFFVRSAPSPAVARAADPPGEAEAPARETPWVNAPVLPPAAPDESLPEFGESARPFAGNHALALFRRLDRNRNGRLDPEELTGTLRAELARWDADEDGLISPDEFRRFFHARVARLAEEIGTNPPAAGQPAGTRLQLATWFAVLDTDGDGRISPGEWQAAGLPAREYRRIDPAGIGAVTPPQVAAALAAGSPFLAAVTRGLAPGAGRAGDGASAPDRSGLDGSATPFAADDPPRGSNLPGYVGQFRPSAKPAPSAPRPTAPSPRPAAPPPPAPPPAPAPAAAPAADPDAIAVTPLPLDDGTDLYWADRNEQNELRLMDPAPISTLFLGDSITDWLANGAGAGVWDSFFAPLGAADFAVAGVTTSQVLWQVEKGQAALAAPKVIVLLIGSNNLGLGQSTTAAAKGVNAVVANLRTQLPKTRILLLGLLPREESAAAPIRAQITEVNQAIAKLDDGRYVHFLDIGGLFVKRDGDISPFIMPDFLHPSAFGYELYALGVYWAVTDLLNQKD